MSKSKPSAFGRFAQQTPVQSQDEIADERQRLERDQDDRGPVGSTGPDAGPTPRRRRAAAPQAVAPADRVQLMVRLTKTDRDRLKEFNLAPHNMTFQQLVVTALNFYLENKMGQKGRPLQTPASYK